MNRILISLLGLFSIILFSCEKECDRKRNTLETVDLHTLRPVGVFKGVKDSKYTITSDSTAVLRYTANDSLYEITYKIETIGTFEKDQQKWDLK
jgi:hypothetical protein